MDRRSIGVAAVVKVVLEHPSENNMVARADHGMIRPGTRSRRGPRMNPTPDRTLNDQQQTIADLQCKLTDAQRRPEERTAEREGAGAASRQY